MKKGMALTAKIIGLLLSVLGLAIFSLSDFTSCKIT